MASINPIGTVVSTSLRAFVQGAQSSTLLTTLTLRRGDILPFSVLFAGPTSPGVNYESLSTYGSLKFTAKNNNDFDGNAVISITTFSTTFNVATYYTATLDLSGTTLSSLFSATNTPQVTLNAELEWIDRLYGATYRNSTSRFNIVVQNEIIKN